MIKINKYEKFFYCDSHCLFAIMLFFGITFFVGYAAFCGVVFTDDGYSLISAKYPNDILINYNLSYIITSKLYYFSHGNVGIFRLTTVMMNFITSIILTYAVIKLLQLNGKLFLLLFVLFYLSGSFIYIHNMLPDYNIPPRVVAILQFSLFLLIINTGFNKYKWLFLLLLGFFTAIDIVLRLPTYIVSCCVIVFAFAILRSRFVYNLVLFTLGMVSFFAIYFTFIQSFGHYSEILLTGMKYSAGEGHTLRLLVNNLNDIVNCLLDVFVFFIIYHVWCKSNKFRLSVNIKLSIICILIILIASIRFILGGGDNEVTTILAIFNRAVFDIIVILWVENFFRRTKIETSDDFSWQKRNIVSLFCLGLVYSVSVGTATPVFYHTVFSFSLIFVVFIIQLISLCPTRNSFKKIVSGINLILFILLLTGVIFFSAGYNNLFKQDIPYKVDNGVIYIDNGTLAEINLLKSSFAICGFKSGDYIFSFYGLPSMIYLAGGRAAVTPWHFNVSPEWNQYIIGKMSQIPSKSLFLLADKERFNQSANMGILENYTQCSEFTFTGRSKFPVGTYIIFRHK